MQICKFALDLWSMVVDTLRNGNLNKMKIVGRINTEKLLIVRLATFELFVFFLEYHLLFSR